MSGATCPLPHRPVANPSGAASLSAPSWPGPSRVATSDNGRAALDRLRHRAADLIILDLRMPVMDGWQFRTIQRADPELAEIPVIAVSADESPQAEAIDADHYLRKPVRVRSCCWPSSACSWAGSVRDWRRACGTPSGSPCWARSPPASVTRSTTPHLRPGQPGPRRE